MSLEPGADGRAAIVVSGRGSFLGTLPLPAATLPPRVQLHASAGACRESTSATAQQSTGLRLRATGS